MTRLRQELEAVIESRMGKVRDQLKGSSEAIFAQVKQQVNTNHIAKNLGNLGDKMKPTNPQTPVATTLSSLHHLMKEIRSDMQTRANEGAKQERQWTQHMEDTRHLTTSVDALTKEIKGQNEIMTTFLLVLTSWTKPDRAIAPHAETLKKMCGVPDGVWDDENDKVETGEDRRDPYPHFKTPLDKTASRPPWGLSPTVRKPGHSHRSRSPASSKSRKSPSPGRHVTSRRSSPPPSWQRHSSPPRSWAPPSRSPDRTRRKTLSEAHDSVVRALKVARSRHSGRQDHRWPLDL